MIWYAVCSMGELTERDDDITRVPEILQRKLSRSVRCVATLLLKILKGEVLSDCPECIARKKKAILAKQAASGESEFIPENEMPVEGEFPMKFDISTKHFICKKCGLYATREQISDIRDRLNRREKTREDKQYDYLEWWQKSKKDKQQR